MLIKVMFQGSDVTYAKVEFTPKNKSHMKKVHDVKLQTPSQASPYATVNAQLPPAPRYTNFGISRDDEHVRYENYRHRSQDEP